MKIKSTILTVFLSMTFLQGCDDDDNNTNTITPTPVVDTSNTIVDVAVANGSFTTLVAALQATGLDQTLSDENSTFTVFAPTDDAFALLGTETINALLADTDTLSDILTYHVVSGEVNAETAVGKAGEKVEMVNGDMLGLSLDGENLLVNTATVVTTDIMTDNGIIHVIDAVLMPPADKGEVSSNIVETAVAAGSFTTLVAALQATGLDATLADESNMFTVFAPTDAAFALLGEDTINILLANIDVLSSILLQHVVSGEVDSVTAYSLNGMQAQTASGAMLNIMIDSESDMLKVGGINVSSKDIYTTNGIIHVIDAVYVGNVEVPVLAPTVVDAAVSNGNFTTLVAALQATGLDSVLAESNGSFTVFAPSDTAFAKLGQDTIAGLLADPQTLSNILLYHVISGAKVNQEGALAKAQSDDKKVEMANGQMAALTLSDSTLFVNNSPVSMADVMAGNGVIHVIDQVIMPPAAKGEPTQSIVDVAVADPNFSTLVAALTAADLVSTLADESKTFTVFAPTNSAFAKIESATLTGLLGDTTTLSKVLLQHVIDGAEIGSLDAYAANGADVDTVSGEDVKVKLVNFAAYMDGDNEEVAYDKMYHRFVGGTGSAHAGKTLYVFDSDLGNATSVCEGECATNWPPVLVTDGRVSDISGVGTVVRSDGSIQATYQGRPLYFFAGDSNAGDATGQGLGNVWWTADQSQTSLRIQGTNVVTKDIYTTNGVIHVIDTVITETLE